ncbi:phage tail tip fiber protein [Photorhabdus viridis]|uniref:phage tail tip fiber protein n=1 Tax=Photorhabdus viridis TaxID=3163327 RepID=UPI00387E30DA
MKYNGKEYDAGMIISSEVKNGKVTTNIGFNAENFTFMNSVNGKLVPFMTAKNEKKLALLILISHRKKDK